MKRLGHHACSLGNRGHEAAVKVLLGAASVEANARAANGWTPLSRAIMTISWLWSFGYT
ncbi:hypothetical protein BX600DRAFT_464387 [Xylariales sp. PMI_506]|nr:hypothetical protein BX600DRAFT_464387 [Xylariales sp. PMI_506]